MFKAHLLPSLMSILFTAMTFLLRLRRIHPLTNRFPFKHRLLSTSISAAVIPTPAITSLSFSEIEMEHAEFFAAQVKKELAFTSERMSTSLRCAAIWPGCPRIYPKLVKWQQSSVFQAWFLQLAISIVEELMGYLLHFSFSVWDEINIVFFY